jgi:hypothetical protein
MLCFKGKSRRKGVVEGLGSEAEVRLFLKHQRQKAQGDGGFRQGGSPTFFGFSCEDQTAWAQSRAWNCLCSDACNSPVLISFASI